MNLNFLAQELVRTGADDVKTATLETIGNLAFARPNKVTFLQSPGLVSWLSSLARDQVGGVSQKSVQVTATRALAILGSPNKRLTKTGICEALEERFEWFRANPDQGWQVCLI